MTDGPLPPARSVLVTGAAGLVGSRVVERLAAHPGEIDKVVALDVRPVAPQDRRPGVDYVVGDIRDHGVEELLRAHEVDTVVHLAAIVTPGPDDTRARQWEIDVAGTENVLGAAAAAGVVQFVHLSSGAAYGYHADNPMPLREADPLRGNPEFAYADHKRQTEELLAAHRRSGSGPAQLIFRPGTILGDAVDSPISAMFDRPVVIGVRGSDAPFVLVWDTDVADAIVNGIVERRTGIYNLCGDGAVDLPEIARRLGKPYIAVPAPLLAAALGVLRRLRLTTLGPEQVPFLRYRPVLANDALKTEFGFTPSMTSEQCFERYRSLRVAPGRHPPDRHDAPVVAITGAAGGIGAALARRFARDGARVALLDRELGGAEAVAATLPPGRTLALPCDVTSTKDCRAAIEKVVGEWGRLDVVVANAGITHLGRVADTDPAVIRRVVDVDLLGAVNTAMAALPELQRTRGAIVVTSSVAGVAPLATRAGYSAAKHGLHGFFDSLRAEHRGDGLRVLLVCPSFVDTAIGAHALGPAGEPVPARARSGVRAPIPPEEVADAVAEGLRRGRRLVFVGRDARRSYWVARLAPRLYERLMLRRLAAG